MPGDAGSNDEELMSQIDELRARMDRLMRGGTSTSNSALLTDSSRQTQTVTPQPKLEPAPERKPVRDLLGPEDKEVFETYPKEQGAVAFPDESPVVSAEDRPVAERPPSPSPTRSRQATVDGSLIAVGEDKSQPRPRVSSFDDIGSAVEQELANDQSVPPATVKRGPDLASRFGPAEEPAVAEPPTPTPAQPEQIDEPEIEEQPEAAAEPDVEEEFEDDHFVPQGRSRRGAVVAIWSFTGLVSATIAALHFTGII